MAWNPTKLASAAPRSPIILAQSAVASSVTGTTAETTLASITIPGGMMGANGVLRIAPIWSLTNNANGKTLQIRLAGTSVFSAALPSVGGYQGIATVRNRNSATSQLTTSGGAYGSVFVNTATINTAVDQVLTITATLANAADTVTLEGYTVEILPS